MTPEELFSLVNQDDAPEKDLKAFRKLLEGKEE